MVKPILVGKEAMKIKKNNKAFSSICKQRNLNSEYMTPLEMAEME